MYKQSNVKNCLRDYSISLCGMVILQNICPQQDLKTSRTSCYSERERSIPSLLFQNFILEVIPQRDLDGTLRSVCSDLSENDIFFMFHKNLLSSHNGC